MARPREAPLAGGGGEGIKAARPGWRRLPPAGSSWRPSTVARRCGRWSRPPHRLHAEAPAMRLGACVVVPHDYWGGRRGQDPPRMVEWAISVPGEKGNCELVPVHAAGPGSGGGGGAVGVPGAAIVAAQEAGHQRDVALHQPPFRPSPRVSQQVWCRASGDRVVVEAAGEQRGSRCSHPPTFT